MPDTNHWPSATATHSTLDKDGKWLPTPQAAPGDAASDTYLLLTKADGFVVSFEYASSCGPVASHDYFNHLEGEDGALEAYEHPGRGYRALGISACKGKVPFAALNVATISAAAQEARQDARDDAEHTRLWMGEGGL